MKRQPFAGISGLEECAALLTLIMHPIILGRNSTAHLLRLGGKLDDKYRRPID